MSAVGETARADLLRAAGAPAAVVDELLAYGVSLAEATGRPGASVPGDDELHVAAWETYARDAASDGALPVLQRRFAQLSFPIEAGISQTAEYRAATRQGQFEAAAAVGRPPSFVEPERITLTIEPSLAGRVPVVVAADRADFETLVRALSARNEPEPVPATMGACLVSGLINWHRVWDHRAAWRTAHAEATDADWSDEFRRLAADKARYQDRVLLLSTGPYSGVTPDDVDAATWRRASLAIRREHECAHYFTWRTFGVIRTHLFDEILADFVGLVRGYGRYPAALARQCLGLAADGRRTGGRIENYRGSPPVSDQAFDVLAVLAARATERLERAWTAAPRHDTDALRTWALAMCHLPLEALTADDLGRRLAAAHAGSGGSE